MPRTFGEIYFNSNGEVTCPICKKLDIVHLEDGAGYDWWICNNSYYATLLLKPFKTICKEILDED